MRIHRIRGNSLQKYYSSPVFYLAKAHKLHVCAFFLFPHELHVPCVKFFKTLHNRGIYSQTPQFNIDSNEV